MRIHEKGLEADPGILLQPGNGTVDGTLGDHLLIAPPYNVTEAEVDMIVQGVCAAIEGVFEDLSKEGSV